MTSHRSPIATLAAILTAPATTLALLILLAAVLVLFVAGTVGVGPVAALLAALALILTSCTVRRFRGLRRPTLLVHLGVLVILAGGGLTSRGFVATKNIYVGTETATFFRWDLEREADLGFAIRVEEVVPRYYPTQVRIGVLHEGRKDRLLEVATDRPVAVADFFVTARDLDPIKKTVTFVVSDAHGTLLARLAPDEPFGSHAFRLVAFQPPKLRQITARLRLIREEKPVAEGEVAINHPFTWQGYQISLTNFAHDDAGRPYIGLQVSRDPGRPVVYGGFVILIAGALLGLVPRRRAG